jgi:hypothetical protein
MYDIQSSRLKLLLDDRMVSHCSWKDDSNLIVWARSKEFGDAYLNLNVDTLKKTPVGVGVLDKFGDGHPTFSPCGRYLVTDTYPDKARMRHLLLYDTIRNGLIEIGQFFSPWKYDGANRCDLHPRWSPDGKKISFDSTHEGIRRSYAVDISEITGKELDV